MPALPGAKVVKALERAGFAVVRVSGSHHVMKHSDGRAVPVPVHAGVQVQDAVGLGGEARSRGKIHERTRRALIASADSHRQMVVPETDATMPCRTAARPGPGNGSLGEGSYDAAHEPVPHHPDGGRAPPPGSRRNAVIRHRTGTSCGPGSCCTPPTAWATTRSPPGWTLPARWSPSGASGSSTSAWPGWATCHGEGGPRPFPLTWWSPSRPWPASCPQPPACRRPAGTDGRLLQRPGRREKDPQRPERLSIHGRSRGQAAQVLLQLGRERVC